LNIFHGNQLSPIHFAGGAADEKLLVLAAKTRSEVYQFYNELIHTNNNFIDSLRDVIASQAKLAQTQIDRDSAFFDELTDLNNQLATLQRQLAKQNVELEHLNQQKNRFLGMAAHDLRGPLTAIMAYCDFLLDEARDVLSDEHLKFLVIIRSSSEFMAALVADLLDISTIESGQLELYMDYVDFGSLIAERIEIHQFLASRKGIIISFAPPEDLPWVEVDPAKIRQVVDNLLSNAVKYSHEGSTVEVSIALETPDILLVVKDQGKGIPAAEQGKLFQFFGRTSVRSPHGEKSTGLGLAISQRIVHGHGGKIWVHSEEGQGSTFSIALPIDRGETDS
jgi:signal transduction histidine kinase